MISRSDLLLTAAQQGSRDGPRNSGVIEMRKPQLMQINFCGGKSCFGWNFRGGTNLNSILLEDSGYRFFVRPQFHYDLTPNPSYKRVEYVAQFASCLEDLDLPALEISNR